jgi:predicted transposase YdaD
MPVLLTAIGSDANVDLLNMQLARNLRKTEDKTKVPRMLVIHISDLYQKHSSDNIYPVHLNEVYPGYLPVTGEGQRLYFRGMDSCDLCFIANSRKEKKDQY